MQPGDSQFCDQCGSRLESGLRGVSEQNASLGKGGSRVAKAVILAIVAIAIVVGGIVGAELIGVDAAKSGELSNGQILRQYPVGQTPSEELSASEWVPNVGYSIVSASVLEVSDFEENGVPAKLASIEVVYENGYIRVKDNVEIPYHLEGEEWVQSGEPYGVDCTSEPMGAIPDEMIVKAMPAAVKGVEKQNASAVYDESAAYEVTMNDTGIVDQNNIGGDRSVIVKMESTVQGKRYEGKMLLVFNWHDGDWHLTSGGFDTETDFPASESTQN